MSSLFKKLPKRPTLKPGGTESATMSATGANLISHLVAGHLRRAVERADPGAAWVVAFIERLRTKQES